MRTEAAEVANECSYSTPISSLATDHHLLPAKTSALPRELTTLLSYIAELSKLPSMPDRDMEYHPFNPKDKDGSQMFLAGDMCVLVLVSLAGGKSE